MLIFCRSDLAAATLSPRIIFIRILLTMPNQEVIPHLNMSLEPTFLTNRPTEADMQERGLLSPNSIAPALQGKARTLQKAMVKDAIALQLASRPDAESLHDKGVHSPGSNISPSLLPAAHNLEKCLKKDAVAKSLRERPTKDELITDGILSPPMA
ncbi:hypothetical protein Naga_100072g5 [Nannochloropsis gaditana]|uniref:Uncharacterized protein n=1 Tax=Nannochloropsis gaditana TaxID=72520 RepID=W7U0L9_9STRA|nr:hypothetical protein Naga_100072g5 [Nannochloropsis gaditana]